MQSAWTAAFNSSGVVPVVIAVPPPSSRLLDARTTLAEHRRLLVVGGWLSLLAATTLIDLHRDHAAAAHLRTAAQLARETGHAEIAAWCLETQAWQVLTEGDYRRGGWLP